MFHDTYVSPLLPVSSRPTTINDKNAWVSEQAVLQDIQILTGSVTKSFSGLDAARERAK